MEFPNIDTAQGEMEDRIDPRASIPRPGKPHICVCICTYKRPLLLKRLLKELSRQETGGRFTYSIVVADNDAEKSGESAAAEARETATVSILYCVEPQRGIARARNMVVANAEGDFLALIDDDEVPGTDWLQTLLTTCEQYGVDGVLAPVKPHFDAAPPAWLIESGLAERPVHPTGTPVEWRGARTGNVLLRRSTIDGDPSPFRPQFRSGEDKDFFRRKTEEGFRFIWSSNAEVFEVLPPARWKRTYFMRRALLIGAMSLRTPAFGVRDAAKSIVAAPLYTIALPFALLLGQHRFMDLLVRFCHHLGVLLALVGIHLVRGEYVSE